MTFQEFKELAENYFTEHKNVLRRGQALMNKLYSVWPEKYHEIKNSEEDCFYNDQLFPSAIKRLEREWKDSDEPEGKEKG